MSFVSLQPLVSRQMMWTQVFSGEWVIFFYSSIFGKSFRLPFLVCRLSCIFLSKRRLKGRKTQKSDTSFMYNCMNVKKKGKKIPFEGAGGLSWHSPDEWKLKNNTSPNVWHTQPQITHAAISTLPREIHLTQTPVRDNSLILPRCSLPDLCPPERSTDNLFSCSGGKWVRVTEVFFFFF